MSLPSLNPISTASPLLSTATTTATGLSNLILITPSQTQGYQPLNAPNPDGTPSLKPNPSSFLFNYEGEQTAELMSDITDHFIEDNTSIEDQIALKPVKITTKGFVSELNDVTPSFLNLAKTIAQKLTTIGAYAPGISETALLAYNQAYQAYQIATNAFNAAVQTWSTLTNAGTSVINGLTISTSPFQSKQQTAFQWFFGYWSTRTLFTIQTPWAIFTNMAIERLHPIQSEETNTFTTFECTFKQIRTVQSAFGPSLASIAQGRLSTSASSLVSQGPSTPQNTLSLTSGLTGSTSAPFFGAF